MLERELKMGAPPAYHLPDLSGLGDGIEASPAEEKRLETVYHDSPDLRLARRGASLRHRRGEGWTLKLPAAPSVGPELTRREITLAGPPTRTPARLLNLVRAWVRGAELGPVARLSTLRQKIRLTDPKGALLAEVVHDEVSVLERRRVLARFRELEVEIQGEAGSRVLPIIAARLRAAGAGEPDPTAKHVRAIGPRAIEPPDPSVPPVRRDSVMGEVARAAVAHAVDLLLRHDPGLRLHDDHEDVHQARVAVRRLRSHLRLFGSMLEPEAETRLASELARLGGVLGRLRDAQVLHERLLGHADRLDAIDRPGLARLAARLDPELEAAQKLVSAEFESDAYMQLIEDLVGVCAAEWSLSDGLRPATDVMPALAARSWKKMRRAVDELGDHPEDAALHRVRILAKRVRYAAEAAAEIVGDPARQFAQAAAGVQTVLGDHQDAINAAAWLRESGASGRAAFVAGRLYGQETRAADRARGRWPASWRTLAQPRLRRWLGTGRPA